MAMLTSPKAIQSTIMKAEALSPRWDRTALRGERARRKKSQIPNSKSQTNPKFQIPKRANAGIWFCSLVFGIFLGFGIWNLGFFIGSLPSSQSASDWSWIGKSPARSSQRAADSADRRHDHRQVGCERGSLKANWYHSGSYPTTPASRRRRSRKTPGSAHCRGEIVPPAP